MSFYWNTIGNNRLTISKKHIEEYNECQQFKSTNATMKPIFAMRSSKILASDFTTNLNYSSFFENVTF